MSRGVGSFLPIWPYRRSGSEISDRRESLWRHHQPRTSRFLLPQYGTPKPEVQICLGKIPMNGIVVKFLGCSGYLISSIFSVTNIALKFHHPGLALLKLDRPSLSLNPQIARMSRKFFCPREIHQRSVAIWNIRDVFCLSFGEHGPNYAGHRPIFPITAQIVSEPARAIHSFIYSRQTLYGFRAGAN